MTPCNLQPNGSTRIAYTRLHSIVIRKSRRRFIDHANDKRTRMLVAFMIDPARALGLSVVAAGVETRAIWDWLVGLGCDEIQGHVVSEPMPPELVADR
jgi:EAL domain-containing protein (putative c-di-GMP-specific phosphodiesterase class I)